MVEKPGCRVRVLKYYAETKAHKEAALAAKESQEKREEKVIN
jgi:hypothetical protein